MKKIDLIWCISLLIIFAVTLTISISNIVDAELPDAVTRILGIVDILALPVLTFTSIKKFNK